MKWRFIISVVALILIISCTRETDPVLADCRLTTIGFGGDTVALAHHFRYDANNRIIEISSSNFRINISYSGNIVSVDEMGATITRYHVNADSLTTYSVGGEPGNTDSCVYFYNTEKYLIKKVHYLNGVLWGSYEFTITNGDITRVVIKQESTPLVITSNLEYDLGKPCKSWIFQRYMVFGWYYFPWLGKPNAHLIKKESQGIDMYSRVYTLNSQGYPEKLTTTFLDSNPPYDEKATLFYQCQ